MNNISVGLMVDIKDCEGVMKTSSGKGTEQAPERTLKRTSRDDNILYIFPRTKFHLERLRSVIFVEDMHSSRRNAVSVMEEHLKKSETEKRSSRLRSQEINLALSKDKSTLCMLKDKEDHDEQSKESCENSSSDRIPSDKSKENKENEPEVDVALKAVNTHENPKIDPFQFVYMMHKKLHDIRKKNKEHQENEEALDTAKEFDVSKYVCDDWDLDEGKVGLFPDDDYALTYKDQPDTLPSVFEEDERFIIVDGLIQLAPEPARPSFIMPFSRKASIGATA